MYYANREFKVIFKDITYGDGDKAIELTDYNYTDLKQMTMAANSKENPHNGAKNNHYAEYKLSADPYNNRLDDLRDAGYAIYLLKLTWIKATLIALINLMKKVSTTPTVQSSLRLM